MQTSSAVDRCVCDASADSFTVDACHLYSVSSAHACTRRVVLRAVSRFMQRDTKLSHELHITGACNRRCTRPRTLLSRIRLARPCTRLIAGVPAAHCCIGTLSNWLLVDARTHPQTHMRAHLYT